MKDFISRERLNPEIIDEILEVNKLIEVKSFTNDIIKPMILENVKQYVFLVMELEIMLLMCIWQMMKKTNWQSVLKNLKVK